MKIKVKAVRKDEIQWAGLDEKNLYELATTTKEKYPVSRLYAGEIATAVADVPLINN